MNEQTPLVSICCLAYNHAPYIRQCLDGFMMQKTDSPFEVLIHDDASTDGTADIIREYEAKYPDIIKPIYQTENQYSKGVGVTSVYQLPRAKGKYVAFCEGDDYWTDSNKLQKQVDFLETNPDFSICCHRYKIFNEDTKEWTPDLGHLLFDKNPEGITFDNEINFTKCWLTKTMTVVFRQAYLDLQILYEYKYTRDMHLFYHLLDNGKGYCMNYDAAVYRIHTGGVWSLKEKMGKLHSNLNVYGELYNHNKSDMLLHKIMSGLQIELYTDFISPKPPFFHFDTLKKLIKIYTECIKKPLLLYPVFCAINLVKRFFRLLSYHNKATISTTNFNG